MITVKKTNIGSFVIALSVPLYGYALSTHDTLYKKKPACYSYIIGDILNDTIDEEHASEVYATPASCQKIITTLVALKKLGPDYTYKTTLSVQKHKKTIKNMVITFSGDPTLTSDQLLSLLQPFKNTKIKGNIILDGLLFKTSPYSKNLMINDIGTNYARPISGINIDKNCIELLFLPKILSKKNYPSIQTSVPYDITSNVTLSHQPSSIKITSSGNTINASGTINIASEPLRYTIAPHDIDYYSKEKIKQILQKLHITGKIIFIKNKNQLPTDLLVVSAIESPPLKDILKPALKASDNFVFDTLYLTIINSCSNNEIYDWQDGDIIIKSLLKKHFNINFENALFVDGSGLSRYNRLQPKKLFLLLKKAFIIPEFIDALPQPGEKEGTLKYRTQLPSTIRAKTGTLSGISSLSGYNCDKNNPKAFVFMVNSFAPPLQETLNLMDLFIKTTISKTNTVTV